VHIVKNTTDYAGRRGIGVLFASRDHQGRLAGYQIILNSRTYHYMGDTHGALLDFDVVDKRGQR
jgi:hypothetical protein